jgi:hypothetical protein
MIQLIKTPRSIRRSQRIARQNAALRANSLPALAAEFGGQYRKAVMRKVRSGEIKGGILGL